MVFNDVDLPAPKARWFGSRDPFVDIVHHESSVAARPRGAALARHQRVRHLRLSTPRCSQEIPSPASGSILTATAIKEQRPDQGPVADAVLMHWRIEPPSRQRPVVLRRIFPATTGFGTTSSLIDEYRRFADVILCRRPAGRWHPRTLHRLRQRCAAIVIRRNHGYASAAEALNLHRQDIDQAAFLVLTNDSFWGPITPSTNSSSACIPAQLT